MSRRWLSALLALIFASCASADEQCAQSLGNMTVSKVTIPCLSVTGRADFMGTTILQQLTVMGSLTATLSTFHATKVVGNVNLTDSTVSGPITVTGSLTAVRTTFSDKITLTGMDATFNHATLHDVYITASKLNKTPIVYLDEGTVVKGNIVFMQGKGTVENHHAELQGKVIGGELK